jgi:hypothetical protein
MQGDFKSTDESTSQKYKRLVINNPTMESVDPLTKTVISEKLAKKNLSELHDIVKEMDAINQEDN